MQSRFDSPLVAVAAVFVLNFAFAVEPPVTPAVAQAPPMLDELLSEKTIPDMAISPSGQYLASVVTSAKSSQLLITDLRTGKRSVIFNFDRFLVGERIDTSISAVSWKSDDRLMLRTLSTVADGINPRSLPYKVILNLGTRLFAIDRAGGHFVRLLGDKRYGALGGALDLGAITSFLPHDPQHIMMQVRGQFGLALFRVDLSTGSGEVVESPSESVAGWWLDVAGKPIVRIQWSSGSLILSRRNPQGEWARFLKVRRRDLKDLPDYEPVGPADQPNKYYMLARPEGRDRVGLYLYDIATESFGEPIIENPRYDLLSAQVSRDGSKVLRHCYIADVRVCEFSDTRINAHMKGVRKYFSNSANALVYDAAEDGNSMLLFVDGPNEAPAYYFYRTDLKNISLLGLEREKLMNKALPTAMVVRWKSADGMDLSGYLTRPAGATDGKKLPLVVMPHGGPEQRDFMTFDVAVQYLAARGYAVFQPNFRGSSGLGKSFAESGYGEWGRKMQSDISDGLRSIVDAGFVDSGRVCIVGASYGGYAALAGAALTPELYRCAVSTAGISDLKAFVNWRKAMYGADSGGYTYWLDAIGDPATAADRLTATSPISFVSSIKAPLLLIHGTDDGIVPFSQSETMMRALDKAGNPTKLIAFEGEGHSFWSDKNQKAWLLAIDRFLWQQLGPGSNVTTPPTPAAARN